MGGLLPGVETIEVNVTSIPENAIAFGHCAVAPWMEQNFLFEVQLLQLNYGNDAQGCGVRI